MRQIALATVVMSLLAPPLTAEQQGSPAELLGRGLAAYQARDWAVCARAFSEATVAGAPGTTAPYNAACCYALAGNGDRAFAQLLVALDRGYRDTTHLEADGDLASLRDDGRWKAVIEAAVKNREAYLGTINRELYEAYEADQGDRRTPDIDWHGVSARDEARRRRVQEILDAGEAKVAADFYHAAMVFQHGDGPEHYEQAWKLALKASKLDASQTGYRWLAAAARDRYLQSIGEPQIYGTQYRKGPDGRWTLEPIDEDAVTDEERQEWGVPPLAAARVRVEELNAGEGP